MKRYVLTIMLAAIFVPALAAAQEEGPEDFDFQMEMHEREMELQHREAQMDIERRMQELELEKHKIELEHMRKPKEHPGYMKDNDDDDDDDRPHPLLLVVLVVHILCAVWVYQDIRRRAGGSGIWIVIALLTGLLGTLVYAVVRIGESQKSQA
jgi:Ni/Co efflux regulator RcnB